MCGKDSQTKRCDDKPLPDSQQATREVFFELLGENVDLLFKGLKTSEHAMMDQAADPSMEDELRVRFGDDDPTASRPPTNILTTDPQPSEDSAISESRVDL